MKKADVVKVFGSQAELARFFDITRGAVSKWQEDIPELWEFRLLKRRPAIMQEISAMKQRRSARNDTGT